MSQIVMTTGKVLKVVGDFLSEPQIAKWVESLATELLQDLAKRIGVSLAKDKNNIDKNNIVKKLETSSLDNLDLSEPLQIAITNSLKRINSFVENAAFEIESGDYQPLKVDAGLLKAVAVPRVFLVKQFSSYVLNRFKDNYELSKYHEFVEMLLLSAVAQNEKEYFERLEVNSRISKKVFLAGKDDGYSWGDSRPAGHYYIYIGSFMFRAAVDGNPIEELQEKIGDLHAGEMEQIMRRLDQVHLDGNIAS